MGDTVKMSETIGIGAYLLTRLKQLGVNTIFGVPGDFELTLLDEIPSAGHEWVGTANELIGAYAADGYARVNGMGAVITTFGPGELSALNGLAGAYAESVPVLHIVGYPSTKAQKAGLMLHHTLGDGRFRGYYEMSKHISCAATVLSDEKNATFEIERVLKSMLEQSRPGYIGIPTDLVHQCANPIPEPLHLTAIQEPDDPKEQTAALTLIESRIVSAKKLALIVDGGATRYGVMSEVLDLIGILKAPFFITPMGKGSVNEKHPYFGGLYAGAMSDVLSKAYVEESDCVLKIGNYPSDLNTGIFTENYRNDALIDFRKRSVQVGTKLYQVEIRHALRSLIDVFQLIPRLKLPSWPPCPPPRCEDIVPPVDMITFDWLLQRLSKFFQSGDLVLVETGSVSIGMAQVTLPEGVSMYNQTLWGSIGYMSGSAVGAFTAAKEQGQKFKRNILITGDGSIQMTIQAVSDLLRLNLNPIIIVLNNFGYTCERFINGPDASYNDIPKWSWPSMLHAFGPDIKSRSYQARTPSDLDALFCDPEVAEAKCAQLIEVLMDKHDAPNTMQRLGKVVAKSNASQE